MTALVKALPLSIAATLIMSLIISPYGPYSVYLHVEPMTWLYFEYNWSWPIFIVFTLLGWIFFWILEIR